MIIAGPCSINNKNYNTLEEIAALGAQGVRVVGLKSRSTHSNNPEEMGMDLEVHKRNKERIINDLDRNNLEIYPSIEIANDLLKQFPQIIVATEIVDPLIQLPVWEKYFKGKLFIWNPSVNQLGWDIETMSKYLERNPNWFLGIKNGKWLGKTGEKTWNGLASYIPDNPEIRNRCFLIHRGFDIEGNIFTPKFRNTPKHDLALRVKRETGLKILFDPSHSLGQELKKQIVRESNRALKKGYDGLLIEVGDSTTDSEQHISIEELKKVLTNKQR